MASYRSLDDVPWTWTAPCRRCAKPEDIEFLLEEAEGKRRFPTRLTVSDGDFTVLCDKCEWEVAWESDLDAAIKCGDTVQAIKLVKEHVSALEPSHVKLVAEALVGSTQPVLGLALDTAYNIMKRPQCSAEDRQVFVALAGEAVRGGRWSSLNWGLYVWFGILMFGDATLHAARLKSLPVLAEMLDTRPVGDLHVRCVTCLKKVSHATLKAAVAGTVDEFMAVASSVLDVLESCETRGTSRAGLVVDALLCVGNVCYADATSPGARTLRHKLVPILVYLLSSVEGISRDVANAILWALTSSPSTRFGAVTTLDLPKDRKALAKHVLDLVQPKAETQEPKAETQEPKAETQVPKAETQFADAS